MFFKRLSTQGFKSFALPTEIELQSGITIVVGPNGCGKSNVFDSIMWALGEQRAKALRGHRMGDIIFAGSSSHKAGNMAEVTLELSNENGMLPIDATEIEITRRLFKTGESEYLINGQSARLKDIQRLVMGTGLGQNSYAIMQQGRIDAIINARPEARRLIIEEAAGISKYKLQKEEAIRRLNRTDEDLHRITDLINEVKRNAGKLKKQAERARKSQELSERLRTYDMVLLARRFSGLIEEREEAELLYEGLGDQLEQLDLRIEQLQEQSDQSRDEMSELMAVLEAAQQSQRELQSERDTSDGEVKVLEERLGHIAERRDRLKIEIETLSGQNTGHTSEIDAHNEEISKLKAEVREDNFSLERKVASLEGLREGATEQEQELAGVREQMATLEADRKDLEGEVRYAQKMLETLSSKKDTGDDQLEALKAAYEEALAKSEEARKATFSVRDEYEQINEKLTEKRESLQKAESRQKDLTQKHGEVMNALRDARARLGALQQLQENYDGFVRGVKGVMTAADQGKLPGVHGVVAMLVKPKEKCERAIEIALGGAIQNIVVETSEDGKECINFLKRKGSGRATFLPLDRIQGRYNNKEFNKLMKMPGVVGWATDHVEYDPHISEAVQFLLGGTIIVEHIDVALLLGKKGIRTKFVTLDGDLINPSGAMSGGSHQASGLLTREGEITSLVEATEELARQLVEYDSDLDRLESSVANYRKAIAELSDKNTQLQISLANAVKDAETLENASKERQERYEEFKEEFDSVEDERTAYEEQVTLNTDYIAEIAGQIKELEEKTKELSKQHGSRSDMINQLGDDIQELKVGLAGKQERLVSAERALERLESDAGRQTEVLTERENELKQLDADEKEATAKIEALRKKVADLVERHAKLEADLKEQSAGQQEKVAALEKLVADQQAAERDRNNLVNEQHEADVKRAQKAAQLDSLNQQAAEKFESSIADVIGSLESELTALAEQRRNAPEEIDEDGKTIIDEAEVVELEFDHADNAPALTDAAGPSAAGSDAVEDQTPAERARWLDHPLAQLPLESLEAEAQELRNKIAQIGPVNMEAIEDYEKIEERLAFMTKQQRDLIKARDTILQTIQKIDETTTTMFRECYDTVREYFIDNFRRLFGGGKADLVLTNPDDLLSTGIDIIAQPPGKKPQTITLLSGGEKCLTAIGLMFALFQWKPSPICVLDEIDAPLDDANVQRFKAMIREFSASTQFIIISHNKLTMELADTIFGITMQDPGVSRVVSVSFDEVEASGLLEDAPATGGKAPGSTDGEVTAEAG